MDFTLQTYRQLLEALQQTGYSFFTFQDWCEVKINEKYIILRHDVDLHAARSLATAQVEAMLGIRASYYFRVVPQSNQPDIIRSIATLGHEIGYHYEDLSFFNGVAEKALVHFNQQLTYFRQFYPVVTICMHGSPTSKYDNSDLWKTFNYKDYGIIGEPYFDIDFDKMFYLTDTGRCWDGEKYSLRDKVKSKFNTSYHCTNDIIEAARNSTLPSQIMITTHPQRWTDGKLAWWKELLMQSSKNLVKKVLVGYSRK